jgi:hypothetical protein
MRPASVVSAIFTPTTLDTAVNDSKKGDQQQPPVALTQVAQRNTGAPALAVAALPLLWVQNVERTLVVLVLPHLTHGTGTVVCRCSTSFSKTVQHSAHWYSKIGIESLPVFLFIQALLPLTGVVFMRGHHLHSTAESGCLLASMLQCSSHHCIIGIACTRQPIALSGGIRGASCIVYSLYVGEPLVI